MSKISSQNKSNSTHISQQGHKHDGSSDETDIKTLLDCLKRFERNLDKRFDNFALNLSLSKAIDHDGPNDNT